MAVERHVADANTSIGRQLVQMWTKARSHLPFFLGKETGCRKRGCLSGVDRHLLGECQRGAIDPAWLDRHEAALRKRSVPTTSSSSTPNFNKATVLQGQQYR